MLMSSENGDFPITQKKDKIMYFKILQTSMGVETDIVLSVSFLFTVHNNL